MQREAHSWELLIQTVIEDNGSTGLGQSFHKLTHQMLTTSPEGRHCHWPHSTDEETEAQRRYK